MRDCLGVSVGATNLVAARVDGTSTVRPAAVPWRGSSLTGFVERVGDPVPIIAPDGSAHDADRLMLAALTDLIRTAGRPGEPVGLAVPAHWRAQIVDRVRALLPGSVVGSDAVAALTALRAHPGLAARGVIVLCDFGATGTSLTLADAAADFRTIGATTRVDDFSGEAIDQALLAHLLAGVEVDPASTSAVASLTGFRQNCRLAKERLSFQAATGLPGARPGTTVRLTRAELEALVREPLDAVLVEIDDLLLRNRIRRADLVAVVSVGGGSRIPLVTQRLSEALRMPVITTPQAQSVAAIGAALLAGREPETLTRVAALPRLAAVPVAPVAPQPHAWSTAEVAEVVEPAAFTELTEDPGRARPDVQFVPGPSDDAGEFAPLAWYRRPAVLFAGAACAAVLAATGLVLTTEVEAVGSATSATSPSSASPTVPVPSAVVSAVPSAAAAAPSTATVVVTPQRSVVRYTPAPQAPAAAPAPQIQPAPQAPPAPVTTTVTETPTTTPTTPPPTTAPPTTTTPPPPTTPPTTASLTTTAPPPPLFTVPPLPTFTVPPILAPPAAEPAPASSAEPSQPITAGDTASGSR